MVWGAFSYHGVGNLVCLEEGVTMNSDNYLELLNDNLEECFEKCQAQTLMQGGAPCHTSNAVMQWLNDCEVDYFPDWPGYSPDLNPIENLWSMMKKQLRDMDTSSVTKLKALLLTVWQNIIMDLLHTLADLFTSKLNEIIMKKGNPTKY